MNKKELMRQNIEKHGNDLLAIFPNATINDPVKLCKKLHKLEIDAHSMATSYCNGVIQSNDWEKAISYFLDKVNKVLNTDRIWINGDARGYALKFDPLPGEVIYKDWGSNAIVAPDFNN